ncbi:hypothetical protein B0H12DRAFT_1068833 [Mycena haematopus]|nr:hypothetical protein B0H12DRAFT_1068833 [Mycena haematopus]
MTATRLLDTALISPKFYRLVRYYLEWSRTHGPDEDSTSVDTEHTATDRNEVSEDVTLNDIDSSCECNVDFHWWSDPDSDQDDEYMLWFAAVAAECLQNVAGAILAPFSLRFEEVRLMLAATGAVIAGSSVAALVNWDPAWRPTHLAIVAPRGTVDIILEFFRFAAGYSLQSAGHGYRMSNTHSRCSIANAHGAQLLVYESKTRDPFSTIATSQFTCEYGAWTATGLFHAYPQLTAYRRALTTPTRLPIRDTLEDQRMLWDSLHRYTSSHYIVDTLGYRAMHTCGVNPSCPATLRTSDDRGCMHIPFPAWDVSSGLVYRDVTCWSLGGTGCLLGVLARPADQGRVFSATGSAVLDGKWATDVLAIAALPTCPADPRQASTDA